MKTDFVIMKKKALVFFIVCYYVNDYLYMCMHACTGSFILTQRDYPPKNKIKPTAKHTFWNGTKSAMADNSE